jgi:hypothetical protein
MNCFDFTTLDLEGCPQPRPRPRPRPPVATEDALDLEAAERLGGILDGRSIGGASRKERIGTEGQKVTEGKSQVVSILKEVNVH